MNLIISEKFYSLQGEGQTMGIPAIFIRLAGCNLLCKSDHWVCDSIEVWKKGDKTPFEDVLNEEWIDRLRNGAHLIFTGGEPMLHQKKILEYITWFIELYQFKPTIEIETNGTKLIDPILKSFIDYINCSPKLKNSGEPYFKRFNALSLEDISKHTGACFKFVISEENDIIEIMQDFTCIDFKKVILMPAGDSVEELNKTRPTVAELAIKLGVKYCDRLQVVIWNQTTGV